MPAIIYKGPEKEKEQPEFRSVESRVDPSQLAFFVPLMIAGAVALVVVFLAVLALIAIQREAPGMSVTVWLCAPALGGIVFIGMFVWLAMWGLGTLERFLNKDIDGNGSIGNRYPDMKVTMDHAGEGRQHQSFFGLPFPDRAFRFVRATLVNNQENAERYWQGNGKLFSESEWDDLVKVLIDNGLARWKNEQHHNVGGWDYTEEGRPVLLDMLKQWEDWVLSQMHQQPPPPPTW